MNPREHIRAVHEGNAPNRVLRFEVWVDGLFAELGASDPNFYLWSSGN